MPVEDYTRASSDDEEAESDLDDESASGGDDDDDEHDEDDDDEENALPKRLRRLFKTEDIRKRYGQDWAKLPSALLRMEDGDEWGGRDRVRPPPLNDPRTHLPQIFSFHGWDCYGGPDFMLRRNHPPQYPSELVSRLRQLHDSGVALQKQDGVEYVVFCRYVEDDLITRSDSDERSDLDETGDNDKTSDKDEESENNREVLGIYETLEQANDRAMEEVENNYKHYMQYEQPEPQDEGPEGIGLNSFIHWNQWNRGANRKFEDEGLTWYVDDAGCVSFDEIELGESLVAYVVEKRKKPTGAEK